jgi:hypothetical protein
MRTILWANRSASIPGEPGNLDIIVTRRGSLEMAAGCLGNRKKSKPSPVAVRKGKRQCGKLLGATQNRS